MKNVNIEIIISNRCYNHESNRTNQIYIYIYTKLLVIYYTRCGFNPRTLKSIVEL